MIKLSAISPRTNAFTASGGEGTPEESSFERIFSNMAYGMLESKAPKLVENVITFRVVESSLDEGKASGVFIVQRGNNVIYVPMLLVQSSVKAPEMFYSKALDAFMPLTEGWLSELDKMSMHQMGDSVDAPGKLESNIDVSGITVPPAVGRFSYASADLRVTPPDLHQVLEVASDTTKVAFAEFLKSNRKSLDTAVRYHGKRIIRTLGRRTGTPCNTQKHAYYVLTPDSTPEEFRTAFAENSKLAYQTALQTGVAVIDTRKTAEVIVKEETPLKHTVPHTSGVYKLLDTTGKVHTAAVFLNPVDVSGNYPAKCKFLLVLPSGDYVLSDKLVAIDTTDELPEGPLKKALVLGEMFIA
mgnify:CR=1 FL=1